MNCDCRVIFATEKHYHLPERTEQHSGPLDRDHWTICRVDQINRASGPELWLQLHFRATFWIKNFVPDLKQRWNMRLMRNHSVVKSWQQLYWRLLHTVHCHCHWHHTIVGTLSNSPQLTAHMYRVYQQKCLTSKYHLEFLVKLTAPRKGCHLYLAA